MRRAGGQNRPGRGSFLRVPIVHRQALAPPTHERLGGRVAPSSRPGPAPGRGGRRAPCWPACGRNPMPRWPKSGRRWWRPAAPRCSARPCGRPWNAWAGDAKKSVHAAERDTARVVALRRLFIEAIQEEEVTRFVFVDETSTNLTYCRRYGRAPAGQRLGHCTAVRTGRPSPPSPLRASGRCSPSREPLMATCLGAGIYRGRGRKQERPRQQLKRIAGRWRGAKAGRIS